MRQVFSSPRIENVEGVAKLLEDAGIEVRITNGRSYRSAIRGNFSYRDSPDAGPRPAVWIVKSEDQPRARQLLREAGLLHTAAGPLPMDSYIPETPHMRRGRVVIAAPTSRRAARIRYGLLAGIALMVVLIYIATRRPAPETASSAPAPASASAPAPAPAPAPAAVRSGTATPPTVPDNIAAPSTAYVIATPPALAETLFAAELDAQQADLFCLAIDGTDPSAELLARLKPSRGEVRPASACADGARERVAIDVTRYRTDGSGVGTVGVVIHHVGSDASRKNRIQQLEVQRTGDQWQVLRKL
jgi:hypothetical protein